LSNLLAGSIARVTPEGTLTQKKTPRSRAPPAAAGASASAPDAEGSGPCRRAPFVSFPRREAVVPRVARRSNGGRDGAGGTTCAVRRGWWCRAAVCLGGAACRLRGVCSLEPNLAWPSRARSGPCPGFVRPRLSSGVRAARVSHGAHAAQG
jgi:hypothetical protein